MKKIFAIGGAVIKTAKPELKQVIENGDVEMLIHNGGSIFHDFQQEMEDLESHSYPLDQLLKSTEVNQKASQRVWEWLCGTAPAPEGSITNLCQNVDISVLMFTGLACDFWQLVCDDWGIIGNRAKVDFDILCKRFESEFHYVCLGSAVIHPEVFIKAIAVSKPKKFRADVVDFMDMYRPRTRVAKYGTYYQMKHVDYLKGLR
jgi:hypothetical protein